MGSTPTGGTCPNDFSNRPGYPHPVSSELENSGIRVAVGDCSVTERRRWRPPYQTGKTVHVHAKHYKHNEDGRTAPGVCGNGSVPLSHSGNVVTRIGIHTHTHTHSCSFYQTTSYSSRHVYLKIKIIQILYLFQTFKNMACFLLHSVKCNIKRMRPNILAIQHTTNGHRFPEFSTK